MPLPKVNFISMAETHFFLLFLLFFLVYTSITSIFLLLSFFPADPNVPLVTRSVASLLLPAQRRATVGPLRGLRTNAAVQAQSLPPQDSEEQVNNYSQFLPIMNRLGKSCRSQEQVSHQDRTSSRRTHRLPDPPHVSCSYHHGPRTNPPQRDNHNRDGPNSGVATPSL